MAYKVKCLACDYEFDAEYGSLSRAERAKGRMQDHNVTCPQCSATADNFEFSYTDTSEPNSRKSIPALVASAIALIAAYIFDLPLFLFVGVATYSFQYIFPAEGKMGYPRALLKTLGLIFIAIGVNQFVQGRPVLKLIPLFILAGGMLTFPTTLKVKRETERRKYEIGLSIMRTFLGIALVGFFLTAFSGALMSGGFNLWLAFLGLSIAFFVVLPEEISDVSGGRTPTSDDRGEQIARAFAAAAEKLKGIGGGIFTGIPWKMLFVLIIFVFAVVVASRFVGGKLVGTVPSIIGIIMGIFLGYVGVRTESPQGVLFGVAAGGGIFFGCTTLAGAEFALVAFATIVSLGAFSALPIPSSRPIIGIPVLAIALMAATTAYPSVMGKAVFGQWWPTVYARIRGVQQSMAPAMTQFTQIQTSLGRGFTCMVSPTECYKQMRLTNTQVEESYRSLYFSEFTPIPEPKIYKPPSKVKGGYDFKATTTLENELEEEEITGIEIYPVTLRRLAKKVSPKEKEVVSVGKSSISGMECHNANPCKIDRLLPQSTRTLTINYKIDGDVPPGGYVQYGVRAGFDVYTTAALNVEVLNKDRWNQLATQGDLDRERKTSTFRWGPVAVGVSAGAKQPLKEGWEVPIVLSFENRGTGLMTSVPEISFDHSSEAFKDAIGKANCVERMKKDLSKSFENKKEKRGSDEMQGLSHNGYMQTVCSVKLPDDVAGGFPTKTLGLTVDVNYRYQISKTNFIEVLYECRDDGDCKGEKVCNLEAPRAICEAPE